MTQTMIMGKPYLQITRFAIPIMLGCLFQQFYNMADTFIVSHTLGVNACAGVSSTSGVSNLIIGFASGLTAGLSIVVAQRYGEGNMQDVKRQYVHNLFLSVITGLLLTVLSLTGVDLFLRLLHTPAEIVPYARQYLRVLFAGIPASILYNFLANTLRAVGDSRSPLHYLLVASGLNIILDFLLIQYTPLGVAGAALATVLSQVVSVVLCFVKMKQSMPALSLKDYHAGIQPANLLANLRLGIPMALQNSVISMGVIFIQYATNNMGTLTVASYELARKIDGIAVEPLRALGMATSTYTAQNIGANRQDRILLGVRQAAVLSLVTSAALAVIMFVGGGVFAGLFIGFGETEVIASAHRFLMVHGVLYGILGLLFVYRFALQGLGYTLIPTIASVMELSMRAFSAFVLVPALGFNGACIETPLSWLGALLPCLFAYGLASCRFRQKTTGSGHGIKGVIL